AIKRDFPEAITNRGVALMRQGKLDEAMAAFQQVMTIKPDYAQACHNAANVLIERGRIDAAIALLHKAIRNQPKLADRHWRLVERMHGGETIQVEIGRPLPKFDVHCSLASLPSIFATRLETIPGRVPYLRVDEPTERTWREKLGGATRGMRVGLAWAGSPNH